MAAQRYDIIFAGEISQDAHLTDVKKNLAALFKVSEKRVERMFTGKPVVIKKHLDYETAVKYSQALKKAGAIGIIRKAESENADIPRTMTCPQCGHTQPETGRCFYCGFVVNPSYNHTSRIMTCPQCKHIQPQRSVCAYCGFAINKDADHPNSPRVSTSSRDKEDARLTPAHVKSLRESFPVKPIIAGCIGFLIIVLITSAVLSLFQEKGPLKPPLHWQYKTEHAVQEIKIWKHLLLAIEGYGASIYALDRNTGQELWRRKPGTAIKEYAALDQNTLMFANVVLDMENLLKSGDKHSGIYALHAATGEDLWNVAVKYPRVRGSDIPFGIPIWSVAFSEGYAAVASMYGVYTVHLQTGKTVRLNAIGTMDIPPGFTDGTVYVIGRERRGSAAACMSIKNPGATLLSLDAYSGKVKWRFPFVYQEINFEEIIIDNGVLFFPHGDTMFAIDAESGKERWRVNARRTIFSSCLCDETVYIATSRKIRALNRETGAEQWEFKEIPRAPVVSLTVDNGIVYAGTSAGDHCIYLLDAETGKQKCTLQFNMAPDPILIHDDTLYTAGVSSGPHIYAVDLKEL